MALPVLANKLFTQHQGVMNKQYLPPYDLPNTLDEEKKEFLKTNQERIQENWSNKSLPTIDKIPPRGKDCPEVSKIHVSPPSIQHVKNIFDEIKWTKVTFP